MEWLVLILLVPAVLVPVILLWGFAGCDLIFELKDPLTPPTDLFATAVSASEIQLTWQSVHTGVVFEIERTRDGSAPVLLTDQPATTSSLDAGLEADTSYFYRVRAVKTGSNASQFSESASATTLPVTGPVTFEPTFETTLPTGDISMAGWTVVQRIEASRLLRSGSQVRLTVSGAPNADFRIDRIFMSQPAASGNEYDSAPDLTLVAANVTVPVSAVPGSVTLPPVAYTLDHDQPLLVAFDISTQNQGSVQTLTGVPNTDAVAFLLPGSDVTPRLEAGLTIRSADYLRRAIILLVLKIEVA